MTNHRTPTRLSFLLAMALLLLTACGSASDSMRPMPGSPPPADMREVDPSTPSVSESSGGENGIFTGQESAPTTDSKVYQDHNAKLIREAQLYLQTTDFTAAADRLNTLVNGCGGYFQSASVEGGSYRDVNADRYGTYQVRIPEEKYTSFLSEAGTLGYLTSKSENTTNVSVEYYDTQAKLAMLRTKQERLLELLAKAEDMEGIISLENALGEVEYEIEQNTSAMNRYDSLVSFSTVNINLQEVMTVTEEPGETSSLGARMGAGLSASALGLVNGFQSLLVWISYHAFGLLIAAALVAGAAVIGTRKMNRRLKNKKSLDKEVPEHKT